MVLVSNIIKITFCLFTHYSCDIFGSNIITLLLIDSKLCHVYMYSYCRLPLISHPFILSTPPILLSVVVFIPFHLLAVNPNHATMSDTIEATKSDEGVVNVTCRDDSLIYLVLLQYSSNPDQLSVGLISGDNRSVILSPGGSGDVNLVVFSWRQEETFLNAVVSFVSQFQAPTSDYVATVSIETSSSQV